MCTNVFQYRAGQKLLPGNTGFIQLRNFPALSVPEAVPNEVPDLGRADLHIEPWEQKERCGFSGGVAKPECVHLNSISSCRLRRGVRAGGFQSQALRQSGPQVVQRLTGTRRNNQRSGKWDLGRPVPALRRRQTLR